MVQATALLHRLLLLLPLFTAAAVLYKKIQNFRIKNPKNITVFATENPEATKPLTRLL